MSEASKRKGVQSTVASGLKRRKKEKNLRQKEKQTVSCCQKGCNMLNALNPLRVAGVMGRACYNIGAAMTNTMLGHREDAVDKISALERRLTKLNKKINKIESKKISYGNSSAEQNLQVIQPAMMQHSMEAPPAPPLASLSMGPPPPAPPLQAAFMTAPPAPPRIVIPTKSGQPKPMFPLMGPDLMEQIKTAKLKKVDRGAKESAPAEMGGGFRISTAQLQAVKLRSSSRTERPLPEAAPATPGRLDFGEMKKLKLKKVPLKRSPGGTPHRNKVKASTPSATPNPMFSIRARIQQEHLKHALQTPSPQSCWSSPRVPATSLDASGKKVHFEDMQDENSSKQALPESDDQVGKGSAISVVASPLTKSHSTIKRTEPTPQKPVRPPLGVR